MMKMLEDLIKNVAIAMETIQNENFLKSESSNFELPVFRSNLKKGVDELTAEATKLSLAYSVLPLPTEEECTFLTKKIEPLSIFVVHEFFKFPIAQGALLLQKIKNYLVSILNALIVLLRQIVEAPNHLVTADLLKNTGNIWEVCDSFSDLPNSNFKAFIIICDCNISLAKDALSEMEEISSGDGNNGCSDVDSDDEVHNSCASQVDSRLYPLGVGLTKVAIATLKKTKLSSTKVTTLSNLETVLIDQIGHSCQSFSELLDEFISSFYSPHELEAIHGNGLILFEHVTAHLNMIKDRICDEDDMDRIEFLLKAAKHNVTKLEEVIKLVKFE